MTDFSSKLLVDIITEFLGFLWLLIAFFVSLIIFLGRKIDTISMPSFRGLNFGQKPKEELPEIEDVNGGFLNRKIVVEKVKNVFGKTVKSKDKSEDEDFDIKKVIKFFQTGRKSVTFAEKDEVINEIISDFETSTSVSLDKEAAKEGGQQTDSNDGNQVKNLLFYEFDENFKQKEGQFYNYTNVSVVNNETKPDNLLTIVVGQELPKPPNEPPPLPPKLIQKSNSKARPSEPPPLPPKASKESKPPLIRRDLKNSLPENDSSVKELVSNFIKLQESFCKKEDKKFNTETLNGEIKNGLETEAKNSLQNGTSKPSSPLKKDWKEAFFQPMNKSLIADLETKQRSMANGTKSSKIPKLVEEIMGKSREKKCEHFTSETLKKCKINVSSLVNNFEQIQKVAENNVKFQTSADGPLEPKHRGCQKIVTDLKASNEERQELQGNMPWTQSCVNGDNSEVFFRAGTLAQLEAQRDEKLADLIIQLQSRCRGYLARRKLAKLKVQDLAVRCIQKNVRKLMQVKEWPWWRLYVKVTPLLNVHRTEEELTAKIQELEALRTTLDKVEQERNKLKLENDKLETKTGNPPESCWL